MRLWSSKTLNACPLFVLFDVLLEDKQKFKQGGVGKCHIFMGIFNDLDSILGLIYIILQFMPIFLRLRLVFACSGFVCRFTHFVSSVRRKGVDLRPKQVTRASKKKPNRPKMDDLRQDPQCKATHKTQQIGESRPPWPVSTTA